jgi:hypothetical protein
VLADNPLIEPPASQSTQPPATSLAAKSGRAVGPIPGSSCPASRSPCPIALLRGFDLHADRPAFAPETQERTVSNRGGGNKRALYSLDFFAERSLHTGVTLSRGSYPCYSVSGAGPPAIRCGWHTEGT